MYILVIIADVEFWTCMPQFLPQLFGLTHIFKPAVFPVSCCRYCPVPRPDVLLYPTRVHVPLQRPDLPRQTQQSGITNFYSHEAFYLVSSFKFIQSFHKTRIHNVTKYENKWIHCNTQCDHKLQDIFNYMTLYGKNPQSVHDKKKGKASNVEGS